VIDGLKNGKRKGGEGMCLNPGRHFCLDSPSAVWCAGTLWRRRRRRDNDVICIHNQSRLSIRANFTILMPFWPKDRHRDEAWNGEGREERRAYVRCACAAPRNMIGSRPTVHGGLEKKLNHYNYYMYIVIRSSSNSAEKYRKTTKQQK